MKRLRVAPLPLPLPPEPLAAVRSHLGLAPGLVRPADDGAPAARAVDGAAAPGFVLLRTGAPGRGLGGVATRTSRSSRETAPSMSDAPDAATARANPFTTCARFADHTRACTDRSARRSLPMYQFDTSSNTTGPNLKEDAMRARAGVLELAILGLLQETPMHGYELRKQLNVLLGSFRALSYGSLYPALKGMVARGLIVGSDSNAAPPHALAGKRSRIVYELTAEGKEFL